MAVKTLIAEETLYWYGEVAREVLGGGGGGSEDLAVSDGVTISEVVTGTGAVAAEGTITERIELTEVFAAELAESTYCFPYGGTGNTPVITLQERLAATSETPAGSWITKKEYTVSWAYGEMQPAFDWGYVKMSRAENGYAESGEAVLWDWKLYPRIELTIVAHLCQQEYFNFLIGKPDVGGVAKPALLTWLEEVQTGYQRRILLYPHGKTVYNQDGVQIAIDATAPLPAPISVFLANNPLETITRIDGNYGGYQITTVFQGRDLMSYSTYTNYITWSEMDAN